MVKRKPALRLGKELAIASTALLVTILGISMSAMGASSLPHIMSVTFGENEGRGEAVIEVSGPVTYKSHWVSSPDRLIVDIDKCALTSKVKPIPVQDGIVKQVRVAQFSPGVVRVVFDLERSAACSITMSKEDGHEILVRFNRRLERVAFEDVSGRQRVTIQVTGSAEYTTAVLGKPDRIVLDFPKTTVVSHASEVPVDNGLVKRVRIGQNSIETARVVIDLDRPTRFRVYRSEEEQGKIIVDFGFRLAGVTFDSLQDLTKVNIQAGGATPTRVERLADPERLVMSFEDTVVDMPSRYLAVEDGVIDRIEVSQEDSMTSVVTFYLPYYLKHNEGPGKAPGDIGLEFARSFCWQKTIVVDPGHGGQDPGAVGFTGLQEKDVTLDISSRLVKLLKAAGAKTVLTRSCDEYVFLPERARIGNGSQAHAFVSIHANSFLEPEPNGTETFFYGTVSESKRLAACVHGALVASLGLRDRNVKERELYLLREVKAPSCLVEVAFASNVEEEVLMMSPDFRQKAASAIFEGLQRYFKEQGS